MAAVPLEYRFDGPAHAPVVLLLGALGPQWTMWEPQLPELTRTTRVLRINYRGSGASPAPVGDYTLSDLAADVCGVLDQCRLDQVSVVGAALGGMIAVQLAVAEPERVRRLALISTTARVSTPGRWWDHVTETRRNGVHAAVAELSKHWFTPEFATARPDICTRFEQEAVGMQPAGFAGCMAAVAGADQRSTLAQVRAPVVVLAAAHDTMTPPAHGKRLAARLPRARFERLPGGAHLLNVERSSAVNETLLHHVGW